MDEVELAELEGERHTPVRRRFGMSGPKWLRD